MRYAFVGVTIFVLGCGTGADAPEAIGAAKVGNPEQTAVLDYLKKNTNDPSSLQIVEWDAPEQTILGGKKTTVIKVKYRAKNGFGALMISNDTFHVRDGKVMSEADVQNDKAKDRQKEWDKLNKDMMKDMGKDLGKDVPKDFGKDLPKDFGKDFDKR